MKFLFGALTLLFLLSGTSTPAQAGSSFSKNSDMFYNQHWVYDRPRVRSDRYRSSDILPHVPVMYHKNADLFDRIKPQYTYGRADMFPHRAVGLQRPYHVLTIDPKQGPYNAR